MNPLMKAKKSKIAPTPRMTSNPVQKIEIKGFGRPSGSLVTSPQYLHFQVSLNALRIFRARLFFGVGWFIVLYKLRLISSSFLPHDFLNPYPEPLAHRPAVKLRKLFNLSL